RGASRPAWRCTRNPAGAFGHMLSGRATMRAPLLAEAVAYGAGRSAPVILRPAPGASVRKSRNGAAGSGVASRAAGTGGGALAAADAGTAPRFTARMNA